MMNNRVCGLLLPIMLVLGGCLAQMSDFPGPYCETRPGGCCDHRKDGCAVPISSKTQADNYSN